MNFNFTFTQDDNFGEYQDVVEEVVANLELDFYPSVELVNSLVAEFGVENLEEELTALYVD